MFGTDVMVIEFACFFNGVFQHLLDPRGLWKPPHLEVLIRTVLNDLAKFRPHFRQVDVQVLQRICSNPSGSGTVSLYHYHPSIFLDKTKEHMLGSDKFTVQSLGFLVGKLHDLDCSIGKTRMKGAYR